MELESKVRQGLARREISRRLVEDILQCNVPIAARYQHLDVIRILRDNCMPFNPGLEALIRGLGILEKYGKNLLKSERPYLWRVVRLSNAIFQQEVDVIKGARDILRHLGYTKYIDDGLSYPEDCLIPDVPVVASVTTDILVLRMELLMLAHAEHRQEDAFYSYIPAIEVKMAQEQVGVGKSVPSNAAWQSSAPAVDVGNIAPHHPPINPPSYNAVLGGAGKPIEQTLQSPVMLQDLENGKRHEETQSSEDNDADLAGQCDLCGQKPAVVKCSQCDNQIFCDDCNKLMHNNPKRKSHRSSITPIQENTNGQIPRNDIWQGSKQPNDTKISLESTNMNSEFHSQSSTEQVGSAMTFNNDDEFNRRVNEMVTDLLSIANPEERRRKLSSFLNDLDSEAATYTDRIKALSSRTNYEPQSLHNLQVQLNRVNDLRKQLPSMCGYEVPRENVSHSNQTSGSLSEGELAIHQFPSVPDIHPPVAGNALTLQQPFAQTLPVVPEAQLIDFEQESNPPAEPYQLLQNTSGNDVLALQDPLVESVTNTEVPAIHGTFPGNDVHTRLKRNLGNEHSEVVQPAKVQRNGTLELQTSSISNRFENMNIEQHEHMLSEPRDGEDVATDDDEYQSAEEGGIDTLNKRVEDPVSMHAPTFLSNLSPIELQNKIKKEEMRYQTTQFLDLIRAGDVSSFRPEQVQVAVNELENEHNTNIYTPTSWLERKWGGYIDNFITSVKEKGYKISKENAEDVLIEADFVFEHALQLIEMVQVEQIEDIAEHFSFDDAKQALVKKKGDKYLATAYLQNPGIKGIFKEFEDSDVVDDQVALLKHAFIANAEDQRKNAFCGLLDLKDGLCSDTLTALLQTMPNDLADTLLEDAIEAITGDAMVTDVAAAIHYLDNECMICTEKFPRSKITCLPTCGDNGCSYCLSCLEQHLTICIRDKNIRDIVCPVCSNPEFGNDEETRTIFFNHIDDILRRASPRVHEIFQQKLRDFTLMRLPNFRWCSHCSGGFQFDVVEGNIRMQCPFCRKETCYKCKKPWEPQHDGIPCEQFQKWKEANDPEFQAAGLARHLKENGIDCPDCKFRYALAKGGCMHFKCSQCSHEFCSGCSKAFKHGRQCGKFQSCGSRGLHAHHPRNCLFFLRDEDPSMLLKLLKENHIQHNMKGLNQKTCEVMEQKETPSGLKDAPCGRAVEPNCSGLCKLHYMEYLVNLVNIHGLDPADVFSIDKLKLCLQREEVAVPPMKLREPEESYRKRLLAEVKKLPIK